MEKLPYGSGLRLMKCVFSLKTQSKDTRPGKMQRHHLLESGFQKAVQAAVEKAGITRPVGNLIPFGIVLPPTYLKTG